MLHITFIHGIGKHELTQVRLKALEADSQNNDAGIHLGTSSIESSLIYLLTSVY
ncbi:hypothetical protein [Maribacter algarum]|uniref:hypothetical protein n=1 Tax=Maribacter algarum (ex Zhang et al. 2020) TaxID=2578118 RepID=UPI0014869201|nr:hypothetical protein [Maribacter algarum]